MAFPNSTNSGSPAGTDAPSLGAPQIRNLKTFIEDVLGITDATSYTAGAVTYQTNGRWTALTRWSLKEGVAIASAAALTPGTDGNLFHVTGTTGMTSIASIDGAGPIWLIFDGAVLITHNATSLILIGGVNYTTVAGDALCFMHEGSGNYRQLFRNMTGLETGTWSDVTGSRAITTVYQNTSGKKRRVAASIEAASTERQNVRFDVGSANPPTLVAGRNFHESGSAGNNQTAPFSVEIPNNWYYRVVAVSGVPTVSSWLELDE